MKIIAFSGYKQSGKSECAKCLIEHGYRRMSFADTLKEMLLLMGIERECLYGSRKEEVIPWLGVTGRHCMQTIGTEWGRELINDDVWVKVMERRLKETPNSIAVVFDDCRFENEVQLIRSLGGVIVRVTRPVSFWTKLWRFLTRYVRHKSEQLPAYDREITNDGTIEDLRVKALVIARGES